MTARSLVRSQAVDAASALLGPIAVRDAPRGPLPTYRVGGSAALLVRPRTIDELAVVGRAVATVGLPLLIVGRGSNLLIADAGFPGIAVTLADLATEIVLPDGDGGELIAIAGGAVALPTLARRTAAAGLTGFEWAVGVPGSVGGAVRMNAGGHGSDMASCLVDVDVVDLGSAEPELVGWSVERIGLRFRGSDVTATQVVVRARIALRPGDRSAAEAEIAEIVRWRREHQPGGQNAGSVFINPVPGEVSAGLLIDELGLRGLRIGTAWVSEKHANFIQAAEGGRAEDVRAVIEVVRQRVAEERGITLRSEVRLIGFEDDGSGGPRVDGEQKTA
jgi:UDP-N-acetylmuramate dehydrogenase